MRVLVTKLSSLGDILHAIPALIEARRARPDIRFDWVADRPFAPLVRRYAPVDRVFESDTYGARTRLLNPAVWQSLRTLRAQLIDRSFDCAIDAQGLMRSALVASLPGVPVAGFDARSVRERPAEVAYQQRLAVSPELQSVERQRRLFAAALCYRIDPLAPRPGLDLGPADPHTAFLVHGSAAASKRWPVDHWIGLAEALVARRLTPRVAWSNPSERATAEAIRAAVPQTEVLDPAPLVDIAAQVGRAGQVIGVDSGLAHFADLAGRRVLMLFQSSAPQRTGPTGPQSLALWHGVTRLDLRRRSADRPPDPDSIVPVADVLSALDRLEARA